MRKKQDGRVCGSKLRTLDLVLAVAASVAGLLLCGGAAAQQKQPEKRNMGLVVTTTCKGEARISLPLRSRGTAGLPILVTMQA